MRAHRRTLVFLVVLITAALACNLGGAPAGEVVADSPTPSPEVPAEPTATEVPPTETPVPATPTVTHLVFPGEPPPEQFFLSDVASGADNHVQRAAAGDNFARNRLERPFAASDMTYRADLDLVRVGISADDVWFYFTMTLYAGPVGSGSSYAIELDLDGDGRGDMLIRAAAPGSGDWTTDGVQVFDDGNADVGGTRPMEADPVDPSWDGYESVVFDQGHGADPDAAWVRLLPGDKVGVQIAVKRSVVADPAFLWSGWADEGVNQPGWIDYNDHFSAAEAGSLTTTLGAVAAVDNTCRMYFGYTPTGSEPGLCVVTGTVRNCSPHPMRMEPGGKMLTPWFEGGAILKNVTIGTYRFYDESTGGTLVLTATLSPGGTITITKTGLGDTYPCQ